MKVVITGGSGFVGAQLARHILASPALTDTSGDACAVSELILFDLGLPDQQIVDPRVRYICGDITDESLMAQVVERADTVFHFASVVSGGAEADLALGLRVNLDGTRGLMDAMARQSHRPKLIFASSCAVYSNGRDLITDETTPTPKSSYGVQKLCLEYLIGDYARKGLIDGRSMRFPTIAVRPGKANLANSSFISNIIREPLAGRSTVCAVDERAEITVMSPARLMDAIVRVHNVEEAEFGWPKAILLPSINVSVAQMLDALDELAGPEIRKLVSFDPQPDVVKMVDEWPQNVATERAQNLGIFGNESAQEIVAEFIADNKPVDL